MSTPSIKKVTNEDKFARKYAHWWKYGGQKHKRGNRRQYRRFLKNKLHQTTKRYP